MTGQVTLELDSIKRLTFRDIQLIILYAFDATHKPSWVLISNRSNLPMVIIVMVEGLTSQDISSFPSICGVPRALVVPSSKFNSCSVRNAFFICGRSCGKKRKLVVPNPIQGSWNASIEQFIMVDSELEDHQYPTAGTEFFVQTPLVSSNSRKVVGLDCEMCVAASGLVLSRMTLVEADFSGPPSSNDDSIYTVLCDVLVQPSEHIIDYNTKYSGITHEMLESVTTTLEEARRILFEYVSASTILVGHSLENDLRALKLVHSRVIDTSTLYVDRRGSGYKSSLRFLAKSHLNLSIQGGSHCSQEDAIVALKLLRMKLLHGEKYGTAASESDNLVNRISSTMPHKSVIIDTAISSKVSSAASIISCDNDEHVVKTAVKQVSQKVHDMVFLRLHHSTEESLLLNARLKMIHRSSPVNSLLIVMSGNLQSPTSE